MKEFLLNPWAIAIVSGLFVVLVPYYIFGVGRSKNYNTQADEKFKLKAEEEEVIFDEKLRSLKMDIVKVIAHDHNLGVRAEYAWLDYAYPDNRKFGQSLQKIEVDVSGDKKKIVTFDVHNVKLKNGREKSVYFEIDSFFADGKPASFNAGYIDQKIKDIYSE